MLIPFEKRDITEEMVAREIPLSSGMMTVSFGLRTTNDERSPFFKNFLRFTL